jgi:hypothetical protein
LQKRPVLSRPAATTALSRAAETSGAADAGGRIHPANGYRKALGLSDPRAFVLGVWLAFVGLVSGGLVFVGLV